MSSDLVGFRFYPTDEELISYFLDNKNNVQTTAQVPSMATFNYNNIMPEVDLYGDVEPWQIWETYGGSELYDQDMLFFTQHKMVNPDGLRIQRKVGSGGTWSEECSRLSMNSASYVLCRLRQNIRKGRKREEISLRQESPMNYAPVGFRFHPTDQQLISYFLHKKVTEEASLYSYKNIVCEFDLFGSTEPWEIWNMYGGHELRNQDLFFFTKLKREPQEFTHSPQDWNEWDLE
ncbi:hypothetical protein ACLB2K_066326 [Fragaria x ananassa]